MRSQSGKLTRIHIAR